ncbi:hypothetical protein [Kocuria himachalensis]
MMTLIQRCLSTNDTLQAEQQTVPKSYSSPVRDLLGRPASDRALASMSIVPPVYPAFEDPDNPVTRYRSILLAGSSATSWEELTDDEKHQWRQAYRCAPAHSYAKTLLHAETIRYGDPEPDTTARWADFTGQVFKWNPSWQRWEGYPFSYSWDQIPRRIFPLIVLPVTERRHPLPAPAPRAVPAICPADDRGGPMEHGVHPRHEAGPGALKSA